MKYLLLLLPFLFIGTAQAQTQISPTHDLALTVKGTVQIPANRIVFDITINAEGDTPQEAYSLHKKRVSALVNLLEKYNIDDKNIKYKPISISERRRRTGNDNFETYYHTRQHVTLTLSDFDVFEKIQIGLIQHGYDQFSAHFTSTKLKEAKDKALKAAIKKAQHKAQIIARTAGVTLGPITQMQYNQVQAINPRVMSFSQAMTMPAPPGLLKYKRMLTVSATISIHYSLD